MTPNSPSAGRLLNACWNRAVDRPPVWMMRQAGRYLPEYRRVRERLSFMELCRDPDAAVEVSLQPFRRFGPDGVIFFSDILIPLEAMGVDIEFGESGPHLPTPARTRADIDRLRPFDPAERLAFTGRILSTLRREVEDRAAVLGFAGAPWTLATYLVEGGSSRSCALLREMMARDKETLRRLLDLLADAIGDTLSYQIASGAQAVQLFDTWAGALSLEDYREWALPAVVRTFGCIRRGKGASRVPVILYVNGCARLIEAMAESGADVLSVDAGIGLAQARRRAPGKALQGNLDPRLLLTAPDEVAVATRAMIAQTKGFGHIVNLGHGVLPQTSIESAEAFFEAARREVDAPAANSPAVSA